MDNVFRGELQPIFQKIKLPLVTDNQHNLQPERPNAGFDRIHPTYQTRFQKWKNGMRKAKILERIPGSTEVQVKTVSVFSPMERKVVIIYYEYMLAILSQKIGIYV